MIVGVSPVVSTPLVKPVLAFCSGFQAVSLNRLQVRKNCSHFQVLALPPRPQLESETEAWRYAALEGEDVQDEEFDGVFAERSRELETQESDEYRDLEDESDDDSDDYVESHEEADDDDEFDEAEDDEKSGGSEEFYETEELDESDELYETDEEFDEEGGSDDGDGSGEFDETGDSGNDDDDGSGEFDETGDSGNDDDDDEFDDDDENPELDDDEPDERARIDRPYKLPLVTGYTGPYPGPKRVDPKRRRGGFEKPAHGLLLLKPPMSEKKLANKILASPQLRLKSLPVLSSLLPSASFRELDKEWINEHSVEVKDILGYAQLCKEYEAKDVENEEQFWQHGNPDPKAHLDTLLYLAFQHEESRRSKQLKHTRFGHSRLAFLGHFVLNLALVELLLQVYPREMPSSLRERAFNLTNKRGFLKMFYKAGLYHLVFPDYEPEQKAFSKRCGVCKSVFFAMIAAIYVTLGMGEVYRLLFETFGLDMDSKAMQPRPRNRHVDVDKVSADFEGRSLTWKDVAFYKPPEDALFACPRLFRACVPPGMYRFRRNLWDTESLPQVMRILGYPLNPGNENPVVTQLRNLELGLGLQLCFMHPSLYRGDHPRFCNERLQLLGASIQDVVIAERLLMKHLDGPSNYLLKRHKRLLVNRVCGRRLRMKRLHYFYQYGQARALDFERFRRLRTFTHANAQQAIHAVGYLVYGKSEVRRLLFDVFESEMPLPTPADFNHILAAHGRRYINTLKHTY